MVKNTQRSNAENFPNLTEDVNLQVQDLEGTPNRIYPQKSSPGDSTIKLLEIRDLGKYPESNNRKVTSLLYRRNNSDDSEFLIRNHEGQKEVEKHFSSAESKELSIQIL